MLILGKHHLCCNKKSRFTVVLGLCILATVFAGTAFGRSIRHIEEKVLTTLVYPINNTFPTINPPADTITDTVALNFLRSYIKIPSVSGHEAAAGRLFINYARKQGLYTRLLQSSDSNFNFTVSLYPLRTGKPNIVLLHHIDVVPPGDSNDWANPPFSALCSSDTIWGRGTLDAKGLGAMQLVALLKIRSASRNKELPYNITLLCVSGEETGGKRGAKIIAEKHLSLLNPVVVLGEGGGGSQNVIPSKSQKVVFGISVAEKSNLWLQLELKFKSSGHGAAPPSLYVNKSMLKALNRLNDIETGLDFNKTNRRMFRELGKLEAGAKGFFIKHISWPLFRPVVKHYFRNEPVFMALVSNTTVLSNFYNPPGPPNQISEKATALLDCRLLPGTGIKKFLRELRFGLFEPRCKITVLDEGPAAEESDPNAEAYKALEGGIKDVFPGSEVVPILFPASTDNNYFRQMGINVYGLTPLLLTREETQTIHGTNERISISGYMAGIKVYQAFLNRMLETKIKVKPLKITAPAADAD